MLKIKKTPGVSSQYTKKEIERRIVVLTQDLVIDEKIKEDLTKGQPGAKKPTSIKQHFQTDHGNLPNVLDTRHTSNTQTEEPSKRTHKKNHGIALADRAHQKEYQPTSHGRRR